MFARLRAAAALELPPMAQPRTEDNADDVLRTLLLPFEQELLTRLEGARVLVLNALASPVWPHEARGWRMQQDFRPRFDALERDGFDVAPELPSGEFDYVLLPAPRQRQQGRALLAQAWTRLAKGGVLVACAGNDSGARSLQADLESLAGAVHWLSKHRCRVSWAVKEAPGEPAIAREWLHADEPAPAANSGLLSRPGVFAWDRVDAGAALLAEHLPTDLAGRGADLGSGHGYLSAQVLARCQGVRALDLYEADARALALARRNLAAHEAVDFGFHWHDVTRGLPRDDYDFIVSNPPFHEGRAEQPRIGRAFIAAASAALRPGGRLLLVANRQLPYEAALAQGFASARTLAEREGYKAIEATR
jgi:16S rRNA (guanine1207-N2)-methyltransferase